MKNYKHVSKSNNAMKLAAVASAAVMLAPVAMNSVSSFAAGHTVSGVYYPASSVVSVASAYKAGSSLQITAPYLFASKDDIMKSVSAALAVKFPAAPSAVIPESYGFGTGYTYQNTYSTTYTPVKAARDSAKTVLDQVFDHEDDNTPAVYFQLDQAQQTEYAGAKKSVDQQFSNLDGSLVSLGDQTSADAFRAENAKMRYYQAKNNNKKLANSLDTPDGDAAGKMYYQSSSFEPAAHTFTTQELADLKADWDAKDTKFRQDTKALQASAKSFADYMDALIATGEKMAPLTNNGAVNKAAMLAAQAIYAMPAGAARDAATKQFNTLVANYRAVTVAKNASTDLGAPAAIDAAANKAVNALLTLADNKTDLQAGKQIGVATVNYNPNYGIQIWDKSGRIVRFDAKDAAAWNALYPNNKVKVGDAKKLAGQTSWKIFKNTYKANGTTYYNLGGDQYIDAAYVTVK